MSRSDVANGTVIATMYGNVLMYRGYCQECRMNAFIERGRLICCGSQYVVKKIVQARVSVTVVTRHADEPERDALVAAQGGLCFYCGRAFWSAVYRRVGQRRRDASRKSGQIVLRPTTDHFVPFVYSQSQDGNNKVAACHICNGIKQSIIFEDGDSAREYLRLRWLQKGYRDE